MLTDAQELFQRDSPQKQLERLELCDDLLRAFDASRRDDVFTPLDLIRAATGTLHRVAMASLLSSIENALANDARPQALSMLETLACWDPGNADLLIPPRSRRETGSLDHVPSGLAVFLEQLVADEAWGMACGEENLRAALGLNCFFAGQPTRAARLLGSVRWDTVVRFHHFLNAFALLYWGGLALEANRMAAGLCCNPRLNTSLDVEGATGIGIACAYSDLPVQAENLLLPLLQKHRKNPLRLFEVLDALILAGHALVLGDFLKETDLLGQLKAELDHPQETRLSCLLFSLGRREEATNGFELLAAKWRRLELPELPAVAFGLVHTGPRAKVNKFARTVGTALRAKGTPLAESELLVVGELQLLAGRVHEARETINRIGLTRCANDPLTPNLVTLHERLSQPEAMRVLLPSLAVGSGPIDPHEFPFVYALSRYEGRLEHGLQRVLAHLESQDHDLMAIHMAIHLHFWLGEFAQAQYYVESPQFNGNGLIAHLSLYWRAQLALAKGDLNSAAEHYESLLIVMDKLPLDLVRRQTWYTHYFEYALLLRFMGRPLRALQIAERSLRLHMAFNNPCRALVALISREARALPHSCREAIFFEQMADVLCSPRTSCQGLLLLHAMNSHVRLGNAAEAERILRRKLPKTIFLSPERTVLGSCSFREWVDLVPQLQPLFFPYFKNTYWNELLESFCN
jgi:tetratricopeptide (TPR) repeat protein